MLFPSHFISALQGSISVGKDIAQHDQFYTLVLSANEGETGVQITATKDNTDFVLVGFFVRPSRLSLQADGFSDRG